MEPHNPGLKNEDTLTFLTDDSISIPVSEAKPKNGNRQRFQFIDVSENSRENKQRNRTIARSHVMKVVRGNQRRRGRSTRLVTPQQAQSVTSEEEASETTWSEPVSQKPKGPDALLERGASTAAFAAGMSQSFASTSLPPSMAEFILPPLQRYSKKPSSFINVLFRFWMSEVWPVYGPPTTPTAFSPLATEWFALLQTSPALFHASVYFTGTCVGAARSTSIIVSTPEMLSHKAEAIRLINRELAKKEIPDTVIGAILGLVEYVEETEEHRQRRMELEQNPPFKRHAIPLPWYDFDQGIAANQVKLHSEQLHLNGIRTIINLKGGIHAIKSPCMAKSLTVSDLYHAALHLRKPYYEFYETPYLAILADDPSINVLATPVEDHRGSGFRALSNLGLDDAILSVMVEMVHFTTTIEGYLTNELVNPNVLALMTRRNANQHRVLSIPSETELEKPPETSMYECCRIAGQLYAAAVLWHIPESQRELILRVRSIMDKVRARDLYGDGSKFYTWVLFIAGVGAENMPERPWFVELLKGLILFLDISSWEEMKALAMSFLWMSSVCDEGGMDLWNEVAERLIP